MKQKNQPNKIFIQGLKVKTIIGTKPKERKQKQFVIIDIETTANITKAAATDNIKHTLDYEALTLRLKQHVQQSQYQLVETLAENLAKIALTEFKLQWIKLRISKIGVVYGTKTTGVEIERSAK